MMLMLLLLTSGLNAQSNVAQALPVDSLCALLEEEKEKSAVLLEQYEKDVSETRISNMLIWIMGFVVIFLAAALIYQNTIKKYAGQLDENEKALIKAKLQISVLENSEGEHCDCLLYTSPSPRD